ncbi:aldehyde dehydrogenase family protein [Mesorhizobium sp. M1A.F.Ca.IN.020.03.2.1]|nr:aldehyde dehydrogenase family protein [Mesorhizobium sp. M1A.F.Ca.IN.020.03.2.1]RWG87194.1 MAG: aldehyde dehydrogenase family protein [Mesorhizobium sp.]RWK18309.1 MAG: aldehyde dehydrogenase family protein [Mesorhizobium sp.]
MRQAGASQSGSVPDHDGTEYKTCRLWHQKVFAPVVMLAPFDPLDDAIKMVNDSPEGQEVASDSLRNAVREDQQRHQRKECR